MLSFRKLLHSRAARNAAASYFSFGSSVVAGLLAIPVAVGFLSKEEIGLWSLANVVMSYLLWMDLGVGDATGRKMAEALVAQDQAEIDQWWTASIGVLLIVAGLIVVAGLGLGHLLPRFFGIGEGLRAEARWLFLGATLIAAMSMPFRVYPGILLAQERFHWVPLVQGMIAWVQFGIFVLLLRLGVGVSSYIWSLGASLLFGWSVFVWRSHAGGSRFRFDAAGFSRGRMRSLFGFSGSIAVSGLCQAALQSLPAVILGRVGGLAAIPSYAFSARGPSMVSGLANRTAYAFYPNLQRLYVSGEFDRFRMRYREVLALSVGAGAVAAGVAFCCNRPLVEWLAGDGFFAGLWANTWFAGGILATCLAGTFMWLLQISGRMGKAALAAVGGLVGGAVLAVLGYDGFGISGVVAALAFVPAAITGTYSLVCGGRNVGCRIPDLIGPALCYAAMAVGVIALGGWIVSSVAATPLALDVFGRSTSLPTLWEFGVGACLVGFGGVIAFRSSKRLANC